MKQYLDLGAGLPTKENTHQVARSFQPDARAASRASSRTRDLHD